MSSNLNQPNDVDFYKEFDLNKELATRSITVELLKQKDYWFERCALPGNPGKYASERIRLLDDALAVFDSDATREAYDLRLLESRSRKLSDVDWLQRATIDLQQRDYDSGADSSQHARAQYPEDPRSYIVSGTIAFHRKEFTNALRYAQQACLYFPNTQQMTEIDQIFAGAYTGLQDYKNALMYANRALESQSLSTGSRAIMLNAKAFALLNLGKFLPALDNAFAAKLELTSQHSSWQLIFDKTVFLTIATVFDGEDSESNRSVRNDVYRMLKFYDYDSRFQRITEYFSLVDESTIYSLVQKPEQSLFANTPFVSTVTSGVLLILFFSTPSALTLSLWLVATTLTALNFVRWRQYQHAMTEYEDATTRIKVAQNRISTLVSEVFDGSSVVIQ